MSTQAAAVPDLSGSFSAGQIWRGSGRAARSLGPWPTGHGPLDEALGGGWPPGHLVEIFLGHPGQGELALLLPALGALTRDAGAGPVLLVGPPHIPYPPALAEQGVALGRLLVAALPGRGHDRPRHPGHDLLWAAGEALDSGACSAVVAWTGAAGARSLSRLQLAAARGRCLAVLVRSPRCRNERSPAVLRLHLHRNRPAGLRIEILRNRFGRTGSVSVDPGPSGPGR